MILKKTGMKLSEEHKRKISEANKGKNPHPMTEECREKIRQSLLKSGHKPPVTHWKTEEHPMYGKTHSDEAKQKISEFRTGKTWEEINGEESAKTNKEKMSERFSGSNNVNYIEFNIEEHLEEILNSNNIKLLCKEKYNIVKKVAKKYEFPDGNKAFEKAIYKNPTKFFTEQIMDQLEKAANKEFSYGNKTANEQSNDEEEIDDENEANSNE